MTMKWSVSCLLLQMHPGLAKGKEHRYPISLIDMLWEMEARGKPSPAMGWAFYPEFQGHGGKHILYYELGRTLLDFKQFEHVEMG